MPIACTFQPTAMDDSASTNDGLNVIHYQPIIAGVTKTLIIAGKRTKQLPKAKAMSSLVQLRAPADGLGLDHVQIAVGPIYQSSSPANLPFYGHPVAITEILDWVV